MTQNDAILSILITQTSLDMSFYITNAMRFDTIVSFHVNHHAISYNSTILCHNTMIQFFKSKTCPDLSKDDEIHKNCPKCLKFE